MKRCPWLAIVLVIVATLTISACSTSPTGSVSAPVVHVAPTATSNTPPPTPTPHLTPLQVPAGWHVFDGPHFAIAYPADWLDETCDGCGGDTSHPETTSTSYIFSTPDKSRSVLVNEKDGVDAGTIHLYCTTMGTPTTFHGLPVRASESAGGFENRLFVTDKAVTYEFGWQPTQPEIQAQYDAIFATFRPEYTTSACS